MEPGRKTEKGRKGPGRAGWSQVRGCSFGLKNSDGDILVMGSNQFFPYGGACIKE